MFSVGSFTRCVLIKSLLAALLVTAKVVRAYSAPFTENNPVLAEGDPVLTGNDSDFDENDNASAEIDYPEHPPAFTRAAMAITDTATSLEDDAVSSLLADALGRAFLHGLDGEEVEDERTEKAQLPTFDQPQLSPSVDGHWATEAELFKRLGESPPEKVVINEEVYTLEGILKKAHRFIFFIVTNSKGERLALKALSSVSNREDELLKMLHETSPAGYYLPFGGSQIVDGIKWIVIPSDLSESHFLDDVLGASRPSL